MTKTEQDGRSAAEIKETLRREQIVRYADQLDAIAGEETALWVLTRALYAEELLRESLHGLTAARERKRAILTTLREHAVVIYSPKILEPLIRAAWVFKLPLVEVRPDETVSVRPDPELVRNARDILTSIRKALQSLPDDLRFLEKDSEVWKLRMQAESLADALAGSEAGSGSGEDAPMAVALERKARGAGLSSRRTLEKQAERAKKRNPELGWPKKKARRT